MKRILVLLTVVALMLAMSVGTALATTHTLEPNPHERSSNSHNCAATETAQWKHNGSVVRTQDRKTEVKRQQAECNHANQK